MTQNNNHGCKVILSNMDDNAPGKSALEKYLNQFGSLQVSHATLRDQDLIESFINVLRNVSGFKALSLVVEGEDYLDIIKQSENSGKPLSELDQENISYYLNDDLFPYMDKIAPKGFYFGSLEGDGACFGYWLAEESEDEE